MSETKKFFTVDEVLATNGRVYVDTAVRDGFVKQRGLSFLEILTTIRRFPQAVTLLEPLAAELFETKSDVKLASITPSTVVDAFLRMGPEAVAAIVAVSIDQAGDTPTEAGLLAAPDEVTLPLLGGAIKATIGEREIDDYFLSLMSHFEAVGLFRQPTKAKTRPAPSAPNRQARRKSASVEKKAA